MSWEVLLLLLLGSMVLLMFSGMPVAFTFIILNVLGIFMLKGGEAGLSQLAMSIFKSVGSFTLLPLPLFILMGEVMFRAGIAPNMIDALDKWFGKVPGRLSLLSVAGGTVFATLSGSSLASVAMLGGTLVPEMEKRGYKKAMTIGPIMASGSLAILIPPSGLAVLLATIAQISIGKFLIAITVPGFLVAAILAGYIIVRCKLQPDLAPGYDVALPPISVRLSAFAKYVVPLSVIIFLVIVLILLGVASPSEAAALGTVGTFLLALAYRRLNWQVIKVSIASSVEVTVMMFMIITGSKAFAEILAFSGATRGLVEIVANAQISPLMVVILTQAIVIVMGMFMEVVSILMITLPVFMPIIAALNLDPMWFCVLMMINTEIAINSPPFGTNLFVMHGVAPKGTTMGDVYAAAVPVCIMDILAMALIIIFPAIALWLPGIMR